MDAAANDRDIKFEQLNRATIEGRGGENVKGGRRGLENALFTINVFPLIQSEINQQQQRLLLWFPTCEFNCFMHTRGQSPLSSTPFLHPLPIHFHQKGTKEVLKFIFLEK